MCTFHPTFQSIESRITISSYACVPRNSESAMKNVVASQPITVGIEADDSFQFYSRGVYTGPCSNTDINHAVTIVGYNATRGHVPYWIIKNSWGTDWGEKGYVRFRRNVRNQMGLCGIATDATYPII